ncbi:hypothetical protein, partial [Mitsuokella multacida]|uniref:hypothetical protein n=1 Tax=Mitsuokella multacida TaxID=52226 RepID=UPI003FA2A5B5
ELDILTLSPADAQKSLYFCAFYVMIKSIWHVFVADKPELANHDCNKMIQEVISHNESYGRKWREPAGHSDD